MYFLVEKFPFPFVVTDESGSITYYIYEDDANVACKELHDGVVIKL